MTSLFGNGIAQICNLCTCIYRLEISLAVNGGGLVPITYLFPWNIVTSAIIIISPPRNGLLSEDVCGIIGKISLALNGRLDLAIYNIPSIVLKFHWKEQHVS